MNKVQRDTKNKNSRANTARKNKTQETPTIHYGNTVDYSLRELSSFTVKTLRMKVGQTLSPTITKNPTTAAWSSLEDFTFTSSSGCISIDNITHTITAVSVGKASVVARHEVTGQTATFVVPVQQLYVLNA